MNLLPEPHNLQLSIIISHPWALFYIISKINTIITCVGICEAYIVSMSTYIHNIKYTQTHTHTHHYHHSFIIIIIPTQKNMLKANISHFMRGLTKVSSLFVFLFASPSLPLPRSLWPPSPDPMVDEQINSFLLFFLVHPRFSGTIFRIHRVTVRKLHCNYEHAQLHGNKVL